MDSGLNVKKALSFLKAGYVLSLPGEKGKVFYRQGRVHIQGDSTRIAIDDMAFLSLYAETLFVLDESLNDEEIVDPGRDKEYYSWRQ